MEVENYVHNLGLFEESDDDIKPDYISPDGKSNNDTEIPNIKCRLASHLPFWKSIGVSDFILQVIEKGYALPFTSEPKPSVFSNNRSARDDKEFVTSKILKLLELGCIREVNRNEVHTINPLSVADNGKKLRLIPDLRYINQHLSLRVPKTKYEDMRTFRDLFEKGDFFFKVDLNSGYHHLDILESHQKYLAFSWITDGKERFFVFTVLKFGLATAPFIFTEVVRVLIKHWRGIAIRIFAFVDDFLGEAKSREEDAETSAQVNGDLERSGFIVCPEKAR